MGEVEVQNGLFPHPHVVVKNQEGYLGTRGPSWEQGVPASHQDPQPWVPVPETEVPIISGCENQQRLWVSEKYGFSSPRHSCLLKGLHGLTHWQTHSLWAPAVGQQFKRYQGHTGRNWSIWLQGKIWKRKLSPRQKCWQGHCSFAEPSPCKHRLAPYAFPSTQLTLFSPP